MTKEDYVEQLYRAGVSREATMTELDRAAVGLLAVGEYQAKRYRLGQTPVPPPVALLLTLRVKERNDREMLAALLDQTKGE